MWPVFIEKFNCEVLRNDAGGEVQLIILFLHQLFTIIYIVGCVRKLKITDPGTNLDHVNVASIRCVIKFRVLRNDTGGEVQLIIFFLHFYWAVLLVLGCVGKLLITPPRTNLDLVNVASIR